jgi:hypothetical protein
MFAAFLPAVSKDALEKMSVGYGQANHPAQAAGVRPHRHH